MQTPKGKCLVGGDGSNRVRIKGTRVLVLPNCKTNAGQVIGVKLTLARPATRGEILPPRLRCQVGKKLTAPKKLSAAKYGSGYVTCAKGKMLIQGRGFKWKTKVAWKAPASKTHKAFNKSRAFKVG